MTSSEKQVQVIARDVTGQRESSWSLSQRAPASVVTVAGVEALDLPIFTGPGQTPVVYHSYEETSGECIDSGEERIGDVLARHGLDSIRVMRVMILPELEAA
jgi:hypothetical protein